MYTNHKGAYSSHTHVHKMVPYIGAPYHGQVLCTLITKGSTLATPMYIKQFPILGAPYHGQVLCTPIKKGSLKGITVDWSSAQLKGIKQVLGGATSLVQRKATLCCS